MTRSSRTDSFLPVNRNYQWIEDSDTLARELESVRTGPVAVDLEADSFHHYYEKTCLIQFVADGRPLIIDPLASPDPAPLERILADRSIRKVFHGSDYDLRLLHRDFGIQVRGLFDTMIAARLTGETAFGLAALLEKHLDIRLDKKYQRADWSRRPVPAEMLEYAVGDIIHLAGLSEILERTLRELGRLEWAEEEFRRLEEVRFQEKKANGDEFLRVKGAKKLKPSELSVLRELFDFRESRARKKDVPRFRILRDPVLLELARSRPADLESLGSVPGLPRSFAGAGLGEALLRRLRKGAEAPPYVPARASAGERRKRTPEEEETIRRIMKAKSELGETLGLDPSLLGSRDLVTRIVAGMSDGKGWRETEGLRRWQEPLLAPILSNGENAVRES